MLASISDYCYLNKWKGFLYAVSKYLQKCIKTLDMKKRRSRISTQRFISASRFMQDRFLNYFALGLADMRTCKDLSMFPVSVHCRTIGYRRNLKCQVNTHSALRNFDEFTVISWSFLPQVNVASFMYIKMYGSVYDS